MYCEYCKELLGRGRANRTANSRVDTPRGSVHLKCFAYVIIDLGLETAFGKLTSRERNIAVARFGLPTLSEDTAGGGATRYRRVNDAAEVAGSYAPEVTNKTEELLKRMRKRGEAAARATTTTEEAREHVELAAKLLAELR